MNSDSNDDNGENDNIDDDSCGHIKYTPTFDFIFLGRVIITIIIIIITINSRLIASIHNILFSWHRLSAV